MGEIGQKNLNGELRYRIPTALTINATFEQAFQHEYHIRRTKIRTG